MIYFRELTEACVGANETRRHEALDNATLDPGLQPILPHLMTFITEGVCFCFLFLKSNFNKHFIYSIH